MYTLCPIWIINSLSSSARRWYCWWVSSISIIGIWQHFRTSIRGGVWGESHEEQGTCGGVLLPPVRSSNSFPMSRSSSIHWSIFRECCTCFKMTRRMEEVLGNEKRVSMVKVVYSMLVSLSPIYLRHILPLRCFPTSSPIWRISSTYRVFPRPWASGMERKWTEWLEGWEKKRSRNLWKCWRTANRFLWQVLILCWLYNRNLLVPHLNLII